MAVARSAIMVDVKASVPVRAHRLAKDVPMDQLLKIAGAVAAVQLLLAVWREWRSARRIVAVAGLDEDTYAVHGCVPLQFAGSRFGFARAAVAMTGFFMVGPKTRKHAFATRGILAVRGSSELDYQQVRPRDPLADSARRRRTPRVFDRSMRRGVAKLLSNRRDPRARQPRLQRACTLRDSTNTRQCCACRRR